MAATSSSLTRWRDIVRRRLVVTAGVMALWGIAIEARLVQLQVFRHDVLVERALRQRLRTIPTHPKRGEIVDRGGQILAYSVDADTIVAVPADVECPVETTRLLCEVLECRREQHDRILTRLDTENLFAYVQQYVSVDTARRIRELDLKGVGFLKQNRRFYPNRELAAHLIGYVGIDNQGLYGLESSYDEEISGQPGRVLMQTDARNRAFSRVERPPTAGVTLELTIDKLIQHIAERELRAAMREHHAAGGSVVVLDPATGEILALANEPTFNPNAFSLSDADARRNRATQDVYQPGSTFKIVTASAALEEGVSHPNQQIDTSPGVWYPGRRPIRDFRDYGVLSFTDMLVKSSNVAASKIGVELGAERLLRYVRRFGFGQAISEDFLGQSRGIVHPAAGLSDSDLARVSIGYTIAVTPLQMAAAMNAVANGGELIAPRVVRALVGEDGRLEVPRRVIRRAIRPETAATMTRILEDVVDHGTATAAQLTGYTVAGKTGTTEKLVDGRYSDTRNVASFAGFVPSTRPRLTILVVVDDVPSGGGVVAAPVFQRIAEASLRHLGVPPNVGAPPPILVSAGSPTPPIVRLTPVRAPASLAASAWTGPQRGLMPDLAGLSARAAFEIATDLGLMTRIRGDGFVVGQTLEPGSAITRGQALILRLERSGVSGARSRSEP
ncbi:MAG: penicillin-binding protein [Candidatus Neomarinimicrobiota bacterium]|nr:MAG: penicillin-binding protein [Candidatus Neomarinimicrobiota bacterium]